MFPVPLTGGLLETSLEDSRDAVLDAHGSFFQSNSTIFISSLSFFSLY